MTNKNRGDRGPSKGPQFKVHFTSAEVKGEKIETKVKIVNFPDEQDLRLLFNDCFVATAATEKHQAEYNFTLPPNTIDAKIRVEVVGYSNKVFDEMTLNIPQLARAEEKKKTGPRLEIVTVRHTEETISAIVARLDSDGKLSPGKICLVDEKPEIESQETDPSGIAIISLPKKSAERRAWLFLPENIGNKTPLNISTIGPEEKGGVNSKKNGQDKALIDRLRSGFTTGRDFYKSLKTKKEDRT